MGVLDNVFGGASGVSTTLHGLLGGTAFVRIKTFERDSTTGELNPTFEEFEVPFVPSENENAKTDLHAPSASRSDVRENVTNLSGTFPCASLAAAIVPERDSIVYGGIEFTIESFDVLKVGDVDVQYSIRARRC